MAHKRPVAEVESFEVESSNGSGQATIEHQHPQNDHLTFACKKKDEFATTLMELSVMALQNCVWRDLK